MELTENKFSRWRVLCLLSNGGEALLYLGTSIAQVRENYTDVFLHFYSDCPQEVRKLVIQKWEGVADKGRWRSQQEAVMPQVSSK